jgi:N-ethylmaleimide reductase
MKKTLFDAINLSGLHLNNRIVMAPMTRARSSQVGDIPNALMAQYYAQRASAGLIISEASQISPQGKGYSFTPGIYSQDQIDGWRLVTDAVHQAGGKMFLQLWHVGRMSHQSLHPDGRPVAPSEILPEAKVWIANAQGQGEMLECPLPRALTVMEIAHIVDDFRNAAKNAILAGFEGVEIHGANGYLIDQFLRTSSNQRQDHYGGIRSNRLRFLLEIVDAIGKEIGTNRIGVRLAPFITARNMDCPDIIPTILDAARALQERKIAYLHLSEADWDDAPQVPNLFRMQLRERFQGCIIVAGNYSAQKGEALVQQGLTDLVAMGRPFIANPDLVERIQNKWPLAEMDKTRLFGGTEQGYTDYSKYVV